MFKNACANKSGITHLRRVAKEMHPIIIFEYTNIKDNFCIKQLQDNSNRKYGMIIYH